ncbi:MAG: hypothetical protein JWN90_443, partial [Parcubacteria group bacterium]|nr:hypothetical protein [Parcubacteria group bacterium]
MRPILCAAQATRERSTDLTNAYLRVLLYTDHIAWPKDLLRLPPTHKSPKTEESDMKTKIILAASLAIAGVSIPATANAAVCQHFYNDPTCHWSSPPTEQDIRDHELAMQSQGQLNQRYYPGNDYDNRYDQNRTVVVTQYHRPRRGDKCF